MPVWITQRDTQYMLITHWLKKREFKLQMLVVLRKTMTNNNNHHHNHLEKRINPHINIHPLAKYTIEKSAYVRNKSRLRHNQTETQEMAVQRKIFWNVLKETINDDQITLLRRINIGEYLWIFYL